MDNKQLFSLLKKIIFLTILSFSMFIFSINVMKYAKFVIEINNTINTAIKQPDAELKPINSILNSSDDYSFLDYNQEKAHTASELNYKNHLPYLKHSDWSDGINILIAGSDREDFHIKRSRADVIIIMRITPQGKILTISIPRDTLITVYGRNNEEYLDKIGHSMYWNGLDGLKRSCELLIGSPIYKVVIIDNFRSFEAFLSVMGGVSIDKKLEGKLGIQWIRNRSFRFGDIERCQRHQVFLKKSVEKLWGMSGYGNYFISSILFTNIRKIIQTDLSNDDFLKLLYTLKVNNFNPENDFYTSVLPGSFSTFDSKLLHRTNLSCWKVDDNIPQMLSLLFHSDRGNLNFLRDFEVSFMDFVKFDLKKISENVKMSLEKKFSSDKKVRVVKLVDTLDSGSSER